ncbi:MAG: hypothetical protein K0A99_07020 [Desulfoarculaceae bacterium]|nr:hypothetical protein [Desulfoarculaceae bacterium]
MLNKSNVYIILFVCFLFVAYLLSFNAHAKEVGEVISVKVLSIKGCEATPPTIDLVKSVAQELKIKIKLTHVVVETSEIATKERFIGSPTVQINGLDIDPSAREIQQFGVT